MPETNTDLETDMRLYRLENTLGVLVDVVAGLAGQHGPELIDHWESTAADIRELFPQAKVGS